MRQTGPLDLGWVGTSKNDISQFPTDVKWELGFNLRRLQKGQRPLCQFRSLRDIKSGLWELKEQDEAGWYRVVYLTAIDGVIWVLHCFQKKSREMSKPDKELVLQRYKQLHDELAKTTKG